ncbi:MAG: ATP-binding protein, partial [Pseudomonadota bacterium]
YLDERRRNVSLTTTQLMAVLVALFAALVLALLQMDRLNKRAAERGRDLRQANTRLNTIVETALDGVVVTDADFQVIDFSPAAEDIFKVGAADAIGRDILTFLDVTAPGVPPLPRNAAIETLLGTTGRLRGTGYCPDANVFPVEIALERATTPSGDIHVAFIRDISRREAAEKELVAARDAALASEQLKSDFLATMSHEIRTPLNGLMGNMQLLGNTSLSATQQRYMQNMATSGRMLMQHVSDVLDITQYDAGKLTIANVVSNLPSLIRDVVVTQGGLAETEKTDLSWGWDGPPLEWVETDPDRFQLILMNLVGNAVKFTRDGEVTITAHHATEGPQDILIVKVQDSGPGISPDQVNRIFEDFVTGDASETRNVGGSGLGLAIAQRFANAMGGHIEVTSELGVGSTFTLTLPITLADAPEMPSASKLRPVIPPMHMLVVEDNMINRTVVREMLETDGHRVTEAIDGKTGLVLAEQTKFDLILMDISMPHLDGRQTAERIASGDGASKDTPIVALTANVMTGSNADFLACGMTAAITKPLKRDTLRQTLWSVSHPPKQMGPILDTGHLQETRETLDPAAFTTIQNRFAAEVDGFLATFTKVPRLGLVEIAETAHKVAGSSALFGAVRLQNALISLERAATGGDGIAVHHARCSLPLLWAETHAALRDSGSSAIPAS